MAKQIQNIAVMTSGGDAPGMNAAIRAVVRTAVFYNLDPFGIYRGYQGLIEGDIERFSARRVSNIINRGGTILKTARSEEFRTVEGRKKAYEQLVKNNIDALVVIGGDGSFTGAEIFSEEFNFPVIGIPGTIDNDIYGTDFTIGFDTASNTATDAIDKIRDTASSHNRLFFIEVMGRNAGFLALYSGIAGGAEEILIPEENIGIDKLIESLRRSKRAGKTSSIVVVAEGDKTGKNVFELAKYVDENLQEYESRVVIVGHIQRGGSPTTFDRVLASRLGVRAVEALLDGRSRVMVGYKNNEVTYTTLKDAISLNRTINKELLNISDILTT
ncbi:MAG TPA: 6-phosphofructokinase [Flavobacteriales bacterium]|jgi:6-phosphofructokinase 1|nr:6-phosphofructokinase [Flavobacteriales bacterium]